MTTRRCSSEAALAQAEVAKAWANAAPTLMHHGPADGMAIWAPQTKELSQRLQHLRGPRLESAPLPDSLAATSAQAARSHGKVILPASVWAKANGPRRPPSAAESEERGGERRPLPGGRRPPSPGTPGSSAVDRPPRRRHARPHRSWAPRPRRPWRSPSC